MINQVIEAITAKLNSKYKEGYKIYADHAEQELQKPCFYIESLPMTARTLIGGRKHITYPFDIHYLTSGGNMEMLQIAEELIDLLEYITLQDNHMLRGRAMSGAIADGVLHFKVDYSVIWFRQKTEIAMEECGLRVGPKG